MKNRSRGGGQATCWSKAYIFFGGGCIIVNSYFHFWEQYVVSVLDVQICLTTSLKKSDAWGCSTYMWNRHHRCHFHRWWSTKTGGRTPRWLGWWNSGAPWEIFVLQGLKRYIHKCYLVTQPRNMRSFQPWLNPIDRGNGKKQFRTGGSRNRIAMDFVKIEEQLNGNSLIHSIFFCVPASDFGSNHRSPNKKMCEWIEPSSRLEW